MPDSRLTARALDAMLGGWRVREPAYEALADAIRLLCLDNRIAPGTALPAERALAQRLALSRTTVASAYRSLRASGHIESARGSGSVTLPLGHRDLGRISAPGGAIDLQQASPAAWPGLAALFAEVAETAPSLVARSGYDVVGRPGLREAIAARYTARGLPTEPDQIMVTTGAQSAIALVASQLVSRGDRALIETPTYPHAADAFSRAGARLVGVPVAVGAGWDLERAAQVLNRAAPSAGYLMPDFHNPTGESMDGETRIRLAELARAAGTVIVADETTAELAIDGAPGSVPFAAVAPEDDDAVITLGSLGKTVWGGLRIGWIRASVDMIRRLAALRPAGDLGTPEFEQSVAERAMAHMPEILAQRSRVLAAGRDALTARIRDLIPEWSVPVAPGGVALWIGLGSPRSSALVLAARRRGLLLSAGPRFAIDGGSERHLRVPITAPAADLVRAAEILADAWAEVAAAGAARPAEQPVDAVV
ncbi:PLP-dependent aminotransferase family protein [Microbacterium indicum]|uniref:MocR-like transcription factor YczR n=1 Tax=Microbacterium indicum TaxID=358100 RepID=UPI00040A7A13|nr:PLP-dependent aminotransferase family protein [Microbacterium indicum]